MDSGATKFSFARAECDFEWVFRTFTAIFSKNEVHNLNIHIFFFQYETLCVKYEWRMLEKKLHENMLHYFLPIRRIVENQAFSLYPNHL